MSPKGPVYPFELDPEGGQFEREEPPTETPPEPELPAPLETPRPWWRRPGLLAFAAVISFVVVGAMIMINMFIGVIINSITEVQTSNIREKLRLQTIEQKEDAIRASLDRLDDELTTLRQNLQARED